MGIALYIFSYLIGFISLILSSYVFYSNERINKDREKLSKSVGSYEKVFNKITTIIQGITTSFMILYFILSSMYMSYIFIPYFVALLVVLSIKRFFYVKNFLIGEKKEKSWSSALLYVLTLVFSVLFIINF